VGRTLVEVVGEVVEVVGEVVEAVGEDPAALGEASAVDPAGGWRDADSGPDGSR
jgi:hypothetical protein